MASNKDLISEAKLLAEELKIEINTDDMNNADLQALVSDLKAKKRDSENDTQADTDSETTHKKQEKLAVAKKLAEELGVEDTSEGLNDEKLTELIKNLKAQKTAAAASRAAAQNQVKKEPKKEEAEEKPPYQIAANKSITTKRDIKADGAAICADDLVGGQETLDRLVNSGYITKN